MPLMAVIANHGLWPLWAIIALGGVQSGDVPDLMVSGFAGIAVMGGIMRAGDPGSLIRSFLEALGTV